MPLEPAHTQLLDAHIGDADALAAIGFGICWPNSSALTGSLDIIVPSGQSPAEALSSAGTRVSPHWLTESGHQPFDPSGNALSVDDVVAHDTPIAWTPNLRLARIDDQTADGATPERRARRLAGEVALYALWVRALDAAGVADPRHEDDLSNNTRGARFRDFLVHVLAASLPADWTVHPEVPLTSIRGLHLRRGVGDRRSDIIVTDAGNRLLAVVSSKWTWRSDRGTEAAQMVPLRLYRPDVPYTLVTAEFPRARVVARESVEDRAYHLCPTWVGAWLSVQASSSPGAEFPTVDALEAEGVRLATALDLPSLRDLIRDLRAIGSIL